MAKQNKCYEKFRMDYDDIPCENCTFFAEQVNGYCGAQCLDCGATLIARNIEGFPMYQCNNCDVQFWHYDNLNVQGKTKENYMKA